MDWALAIERNRDALRRVLASLVAMAGGSFPFSPCGRRWPSTAALPPNARPDEGYDAPPTLPRHLHRAVLRLLRPAEAAARRLIIVMAREIVVTPLPPRAVGSDPVPARGQPGGGADFVVEGDTLRYQRPLPLIDPLKRPHRRRATPCGVPRISTPGISGLFAIPVRPPVLPDDPISAARLSARLTALASALDDLPAQAKRFARWRVRATQPANAASPPRRRRVWPLRPGHPPGWHRKKTHAVYDLVDELHALAFETLERRDSS